MLRKILEEQLKYTCPHSPPQEAGKCSMCKSRIDQALSAIQKEIESLVPKEKVVIHENKSPKPDIINDCEVRREGYNQCRDDFKFNLSKKFKEE